MILATTTSTQDSGLLDVLVPAFEQKRGYQVKTIAVGSGEALAMGSRGEADVILAHSPQAEEDFIKGGFGVSRKRVMHNDFILLGPSNDPAGVKGQVKAAEAMKGIVQAKSVFVSRADESGTHQLEKKLWKEAGIAPAGGWYIQSGQGMGETLRIADEKNAYTLSDRATYLAWKGKVRLVMVLEKDASLLNFYSVIEVNPARFSRVNSQGAKAFSDFLISPEGQKIIKDFGIKEYGQPLFFPDAVP